MKKVNAVAAIILRNNKILTIIQDKGIFKRMYWVPAGRLNKNEKLNDGLCREVKEEVGINVKPLKLLGKTKWFWKNEEFDICFFICKICGSDKIHLDHEIKKAEWINTEELVKREEVVPLLKFLLLEKLWDKW